MKSLYPLGRRHMGVGTGTWGWSEKEGGGILREEEDMEGGRGKDRGLGMVEI
jgi:hypothetical protein